MTREEAIEVIKRTKGAMVYTEKEKEALETLIPELAESEDERIRKALIEVFKKKLERGFEWVEYGIPNRSVLDWLEKQKEQKVDIDKEKLIRHCIGLILTDATDERFKDYGLTLKECLTWLGEQKEQKSWSEEEYGGRLFDIEHYLDGTLQLSPDRRIACIDFLKSLRSCPKSSDNWKPSKQEKGALRTAISILTEERSFPKAAGHLQAILDAFDGEESRKESRKEWKPSEEQMDALKHLVEYVSPSEKFIVIIKNLYDDLKKLI